MDKLKTYLTKNDISLAEFARGINRSEATASRIMNGKRLPSDSETFVAVYVFTGGHVDPNSFFPLPDKEELKRHRRVNSIAKQGKNYNGQTATT